MSIFDDYLPEEEYLHPAWFGCLSWAIGKPEFIDAYCKESGNSWQPSVGINAMIDKATGVDAEFMKGFANWMNQNIWGENE